MIYAILSLLVLASPVLGRTVNHGDDMMGCYGDMGPNDITEVAIKAVKGILMDKDPAAVEQYVSENFIDHNPLLAGGKEEIISILALPFEYTVGQVAVMGNSLWMHSRIAGLTPDPVITIEIFRFEEGKLAERWDVTQIEVPANETVSGLPMLTIDQDNPLVKALTK